MIEEDVDQPSIDPPWGVGRTVQLVYQDDSREEGVIVKMGMTDKRVAFVDVDFDNWIERFNAKVFVPWFDGGECVWATMKRGIVIDNFVKNQLRSRH